MAKKVWRNKSKHCFFGVGPGCPVPEKKRFPLSNGESFPPGLAVEADIDGRINSSALQAVMMWGPPAALDAECKALKISEDRFDKGQQEDFGENQFRLFMGAASVMEDVSTEYRHAVQAASGNLEIGKALKDRDERIVVLEKELAEAAQKAKEMDSEIATLKAERGAKAKVRLGV
jgi:hypothetical protein